MSDARVALRDVVSALDLELRSNDFPDYGGAVNGLQIANGGYVTRVAVAVDASLSAISEAAAIKANLLVVHHGMFWAGVQPLIGTSYQKQRTLLTNDIAVYSSHLPLDAHPHLGNNARLAEALGLSAQRGFGRYKTVDIGVSGDCDEAADVIVERAQIFASRYGGTVRTSVSPAGRRTRRWAMISGGGASTESLREARERGIDTLIVGEGAHHTTVEAIEDDLLVIYAGHYATETLGVQALGAWLATRFGLPWSFLHLPTGS